MARLFWITAIVALIALSFAFVYEAKTDPNLVGPGVSFIN